MASPAEQFTRAMYQIERRAEARARRIWREYRAEIADVLDGSGALLPISLMQIAQRAASQLTGFAIGGEIYRAVEALITAQVGSMPLAMGAAQLVEGLPVLTYEAWQASATGILLSEATRIQLANADAAALRARLLTGSDGRASAWELALNSLVLATALLVWGHGNGLVVRMGRAASERDGIEYQKQAIAHLDARTTPICRAVNHQIRPLDKPFDTRAGRIMNPPFHHRCRTAVVLYHPSFDE